MKLLAIIVSFSLIISILCGCSNTVHGLSQDANHFSDSVNRAINQ